MKKDSDKPTDIAVMSEDMKREIKKDILSFGVQPYQYEKFFEIVMAQKGTTVMQYSLSEMETYRDRYVKKYEKGLNDSFMFEKYSKNGDGFIPRMFWDRVLKL